MESPPSILFSRLSRIVQCTAALCVSLLALLIGSMALLVMGLNIPFGKSIASDVASTLLQREIHYTGHLYPRLTQWPLTLHISGLQIANAPGMQPETMASIGEAEITLLLSPLWQAEVVIHQLHLKKSRLHLQRTADYRANWQFGHHEATTEPAPPPEEQAPPYPDIQWLRLQDAEVTYQDAPNQLDVTLTGHTQGEKVQLQGKGHYNQQPFTLQAQTGRLRDFTARRFPVTFHVEAGHTTVHAEGTLPAPGQLAGMDMHLSVQGADAADLYPLTGIALLPTPPYAVKGQLTFDGTVWHYHSFSGHMGDSDIQGNLQWNTAPKRPKLTARLHAKHLDIADLGPLIGLPPQKPLSQAQQAAAAELETSPRVIPDASLDIAKLASLDADVEFVGDRVISANLPLDHFFMKLRLNDRVLTLQPLRFGTANGDIALYMTADGQQQPIEAETEVRFNRLSLRQLMADIQKSLPSTDTPSGLMGGTLTFKGRGNSVHAQLANAHGHAGIGMEGGAISNLLIELLGLDVAESLGLWLGEDQVTPIRCMVADFAITSGTMHSEQWILDTGDTQIQGEGTIQLATETMHLRLTPYPKDTSLLSLRSPITIGGHFKEPQIGIVPTHLALRGGAAVALSAWLTPAAALLAFIEPGLGEDSQCAQLIHRLEAETHPESIPHNPIPTDEKTNAP